MSVTPNGLDVYSRYMDDMFDLKDVIGVPTVWQQFYGKSQFGNSKTIYSPFSEVIDIDLIGANERTAKLIPRGTDSRHTGDIQRNTTTQYFTTKNMVFPFAEELGDISANQINKRLAGENPYEGQDKISRLRKLALEHHKEHIRRYVRLFELLAGSSLLTGQMPAILGTNNPDLIYDWGRNAALTITPTVAWNNAAADIIGDIDNAFDLVRQLGKVKFNLMFMARDVSHAFFNDATIQKLADNRRITLVQVGEGIQVPQMFSDLVAAGADYLGYIGTPQGRRLDLFCYNDFYDDPDGVSQPYMPDGTAFLAYYGARCDRYFGPSERLPLVSTDMAWYSEMFGFSPLSVPFPDKIMAPGIVTPDMFYCDAYQSGDKKKVTVRTQSAPIFATTQTNAFATLNNLIEGEVSS
jgi:hypothetical protein